MADEIPSFEKTLEANLRVLAAEIENQRARPEMQDAAERELVKEAIKASAEEGDGVRHEAVPMPTPGAPTSPNDSPLPDYAQNAPPETKLEIEYLLDVALRQGLPKAFAESQKSSYFVQDAFHDALAGRLYPELQKRGIVK